MKTETQIGYIFEPSDFREVGQFVLQPRRDENGVLLNVQYSHVCQIVKVWSNNTFGVMGVLKGEIMNEFDSRVKLANFLTSCCFRPANMHEVEGLVKEMFRRNEFQITK
jgi:hypothetical protein